MNNTKILEELTKLAKSNDDIEKFGDGYEKAINEAIEVVKNCSIHSVSNQRELLIGALEEYNKVKYEWSKLTYEDYVNEYHPNL